VAGQQLIKEAIRQRPGQAQGTAPT
jgi:hypothetical protein